MNDEYFNGLYDLTPGNAIDHPAVKILLDGADLNPPHTHTTFKDGYEYILIVHEGGREATPPKRDHLRLVK